MSGGINTRNGMGSPRSRDKSLSGTSAKAEGLNEQQIMTMIHCIQSIGGLSVEALMKACDIPLNLTGNVRRALLEKAKLRFISIKKVNDGNTRSNLYYPYEPSDEEDEDE